MRFGTIFVSLVAVASGASAALSPPSSPPALEPRHGDGDGHDMKMNGSMPMAKPAAAATATRSDKSLAALVICGVAGVMLGVTM